MNSLPRTTILIDNVQKRTQVISQKLVFISWLLHASNYAASFREITLNIAHRYSLFNSLEMK